MMALAIGIILAEIAAIALMIKFPHPRKSRKDR